MTIPDFLVPDEVPFVFDHESLDWTLPNGETISGWVSGDNTCRRFIYIWFATDDVPGLLRGSVEYRVFPFEQPDGAWHPFSLGNKVYRPTADDCEPFSTQDAQLGARFKLPVGRYSFAFRLHYEGKPVELRGGNFHVYRNAREVTESRAEQMRLFRSLPRRARPA